MKSVYCRLLAVVLLSLCLFGCTKEERTDYSELEKRLMQADKRFAYDYDTLFFTDSAFYITYSLCTEEDAMLILSVDAGKTVTGIKLTALRENLTEDFLSLYTDFCYSLCLAFAPGETGYALYEASPVKTLTAESGNDLQTATVHRYKTVFFSDAVGISFGLERQ